MTQGERVKEVRKSLSLTLEKFGEKIGMKKSSISQVENNKNALTEQVAKAICREYHVDYVWLTTGEGEMFLDSEVTTVERIKQIMQSNDDFRKNLFKFLLDLNDNDLKAMERIINKSIISFKDDSSKES